MKTLAQIIALAVRRHISPAALEEHFDTLDERRLAIRLVPILDRLESGVLDASPAALSQVESIAESRSLPAAERRLARGDAIQLLEGWMEPGKFIVRTIARHRLRPQPPSRFGQAPREIQLSEAALEVSS